MPYEVFTLKHNPEKTDPSYYVRMLEYFNLKKALREVVWVIWGPSGPFWDDGTVRALAAYR
jgi:hypothetical protein